MYRAVLKNRPKHWLALHQLGSVHLARGELTDALECIGAAMKSNSSSAEIASNYGVVLRRLKRDSEAIEYFNRALILKPGYAPALLTRGASLQRLGRRTEALANFGTIPSRRVLGRVLVIAATCPSPSPTASPRASCDPLWGSDMSIPKRFAVHDGEGISSFRHSRSLPDLREWKELRRIRATPASHGARAARLLSSVAYVAGGSEPLSNYIKKGMTAKPRNAWSVESVSDSKESISVYFCSEIDLPIEQIKSHS